MVDQKSFTSLNIAHEAFKVFGERVKPVNIEMQYCEEVGFFLKKVEDAHKRAEDSQLFFR